MEEKTAYLREFAAGVDPLGYFSGQYGQEAEREGASDAKLWAHRGLGAAGGILGSGLLVPSAVSGIVQGARGAAQAGPGVASRLVGGARGFAEGFQKPVKGLWDAGRTAKYLGRAARTPGGATATAKELESFKNTLRQVPLGAAEPHIAKAQSSLGAEGQRAAVQRFSDAASKVQGQMAGDVSRAAEGVQQVVGNASKLRDRAREGLADAALDLRDVGPAGAMSRLRGSAAKARAQASEAAGTVGDEAQRLKDTAAKVRAQVQEEASGIADNDAQRFIGIAEGARSGKLHLSPQDAEALHGQAKGELTKFVSGLGLGGVVGGVGAVSQYEKGRSAEQQTQQRIQNALAAQQTKVSAAKDSGFYKGEVTSPHTVKFKTEFQGIPINVDRPRGFIMKGKDSKGNDWARRYRYDYGFIPKTLGGDDDGLDVFIGPDKKHPYAYWAVQRKEDGSFDEYKVFLGFSDRDAAVSAYRQHIPKKYFRGMLTLKVEMMKAMLGKVNPEEKIKRATVAAFIDELGNISRKYSA